MSKALKMLRANPLRYSTLLNPQHPLWQNEQARTFHQKLHKDPFDNGLRLVYGDFLEEHGDPESDAQRMIAGQQLTPRYTALADTGFTNPWTWDHATQAPMPGSRSTPPVEIWPYLGRRSAAYDPPPHSSEGVFDLGNSLGSFANYKTAPSAYADLIRAWLAHKEDEPFREWYKLPLEDRRPSSNLLWPLYPSGARRENALLHLRDAWHQFHGKTSRVSLTQQPNPPAYTPPVRMARKTQCCTIKEVNAEDVRNTSKQDEEFCSFSIHEFQKDIPPGEIWIDQSLSETDKKFCILHAQTTLHAIRDGKTPDEAYDIGLKRNKAEREKHLGKHTSTRRSSTRENQCITGQYRRTGDGVKINLVDGEKVRDLYKTDFSQGGHGYVYPWVPKDEIWIENTLSDPEKEKVLVHEEHERTLMKDRGYTYAVAHRRAAAKEWEHRHGTKKLRRLSWRIKYMSQRGWLAANPTILSLANKYLVARGMTPHPAQTPYVKYQPLVHQKIAQVWENAKHDPTNPQVQQSYDAFKRDTLNQFLALRDAGITVEFEPEINEHGNAAYKNSNEMIADLKNNKHLWVYKYGDLPSDHPLQEESPIPGFNYNHLFRAVHDVFGHALYGTQFHPQGEEQAWRAHQTMYSPEAQMAMGNETRSQNSWLHQGPQSNVPYYDRPYAPQKATVTPDFVRQKYARAIRYAKIVASENSDVGLPFHQSLNRMRGPAQAAYRKVSAEILGKLGISNYVQHNAIGDWVDGTEHSVVHSIDQPLDPKLAEYAAAWIGLLSNQKAVLRFNESDKGPDSFYEIPTQATDPEQLRKSLDKSGIAFRTLVPTGKTWAVLIYDQGRMLRDRVANFAKGNNAIVRESAGTGEFVGDGSDTPSRSRARAKYRSIIAAYESGNNQQSNPGQTVPGKASPGDVRSDSGQEQNVALGRAGTKKGGPVRYAAEYGAEYTGVMSPQGELHRLLPGELHLNAFERLGIKAPPDAQSHADQYQEAYKQGWARLLHLGPQLHVESWHEHNPRVRRSLAGFVDPQKIKTIQHTIWNPSQQPVVRSESTSDEPERYAANKKKTRLKAPPNGIIYRGLFYQGGKFIPLGEAQKTGLVKYAAPRPPSAPRPDDQATKVQPITPRRPPPEGLINTSFNPQPVEPVNQKSYTKKLNKLLGQGRAGLGSAVGNLGDFHPAPQPSVVMNPDMTIDRSGASQLYPHDPLTGRQGSPNPNQPESGIHPTPTKTIYPDQIISPSGDVAPARDYYPPQRPKAYTGLQTGFARSPTEGPSIYNIKPEEMPPMATLVPPKPPPQKPQMRSTDLGEWASEYGKNLKGLGKIIGDVGSRVISGLDKVGNKALQAAELDTSLPALDNSLHGRIASFLDRLTKRPTT